MIKKILRYRAVSATSFAAIAFVLGGFLFAYFDLRRIGVGPLILHFDDIEGVTSVGSLRTVVFVGVLGLMTTIMNFFIALELEARDRFLGKIAAAVTLIIAILLFIAFLAIVNVN